MNYMNIAMIKEDVQPSCAFKNRNIKITWTVQNYPKKPQWMWCSTCCLLRVSLCLQEQKNAFYHLEFRSYRLKFKILKSEKKIERMLSLSTQKRFVKQNVQACLFKLKPIRKIGLRNNQFSRFIFVCVCGGILKLYFNEKLRIGMVMSAIFNTDCFELSFVFPWKLNVNVTDKNWAHYSEAKLQL